MEQTHLDGEDLDSYLFTEQLSLPHTAKAPPSFDLQQLHRPVTQDGGRRHQTGVLQENRNRRFWVRWDPSDLSRFPQNNQTDLHAPSSSSSSSSVDIISVRQAQAASQWSVFVHIEGGREEWEKLLPPSECGRRSEAQTQTGGHSQSWSEICRQSPPTALSCWQPWSQVYSQGTEMSSWHHLKCLSLFDMNKRSESWSRRVRKRWAFLVSCMCLLPSQQSGLIETKSQDLALIWSGEPCSVWTQPITQCSDNFVRRHWFPRVPMATQSQKVWAELLRLSLSH